MDSDNVPIEENQQELEQHIVIEEENVVSNENTKNSSNKCFETYL